jgi:hypothetical protein
MMMVLAFLIGTVPGHDTESTRATESGVATLDTVSFLYELLKGDKGDVASSDIVINPEFNRSGILVPAGADSVSVPVSVTSETAGSADLFTVVANDLNEGDAPWGDGSWAGEAVSEPAAAGVVTDVNVSSLLTEVSQTLRFYALLNAIDAFGFTGKTYETASADPLDLTISRVADVGGNLLPDNPFTDLPVGVPWRATVGSTTVYAANLEDPGASKQIRSDLNNVSHNVDANHTIVTPNTQALVDAGLISAGDDAAVVIKVASTPRSIIDSVTGPDHSTTRSWGTAVDDASPEESAVIDQTEGSSFIEISIIASSGTGSVEVNDLAGTDGVTLVVSGLANPTADNTQLYSFPTSVNFDGVELTIENDPIADEEWTLVDSDPVVALSDDGVTDGFTVNLTSLSMFAAFNAGMEISSVYSMYEGDLEVDTATPLEIFGFFPVAAALNMALAEATYAVYIGSDGAAILAELEVGTALVGNSSAVLAAAAAPASQEEDEAKAVGDSVTAYDSEDGNTMYVTSPEFSSAANLTLVIAAKDAEGNVTQTTSRDDLLTVAGGIPPGPPVITLVGGNVTLECGESYTDEGAAAADSNGGDISGDIVVGGDTVDTAAAGTYTITYNVVDSGSQAAEEVTRTVTVTDSGNPEITLAGDAEIAILAGSSYSEPGFSATDGCEGDLTGSVVVGGDTVDADTPGVYVVTYNVSDSSGNAAAEVTRTVIVDALSSFNLTGVSPDTGPLDGGTAVTLSGEFLEAGQAAIASIATASASYRVYFSEHTTAADIENETDSRDLADFAAASEVVSRDSMEVIAPDGRTSTTRSVWVVIAELNDDGSVKRITSPRRYTYRDGAAPTDLLDIARELLDDFDNLDGDNDDQLTIDEITGSDAKVLDIDQATFNQLDLDGNGFVTRAELRRILGEGAEVTSIDPAEAWVFGGIVARVEGVNLANDVVLRWGDAATGTSATVYSADPDGGEAFVIVPVSNDTGSEDSYNEPVTALVPDVTDPNVIIEGTTSQDFTRVRFDSTSRADENLTAFWFEADAGVSDVALASNEATSLDIPADTTAEAGALVFGIARVGTAGTALVSGLTGDRQDDSISDLSVYFYAPLFGAGSKGNTPPVNNTPPAGNTPPAETNAPTAGDPPAGGSYAGGGLAGITVNASGERVRIDADGNEVAVEPMLLSFAAGTDAIAPADVRAGLTLWSAPSAFDYVTLELTEDATGTTAYQSTLLNAEVDPALTDASTAVDMVSMARVYSLNGFSLRANAPMAAEVAAAIVADTRNAGLGETSRNGGADFTFYSPLGHLARVDRIEFTTDGSSDVIGTASVENGLLGAQGVDENALAFTTPDFSSSSVTVDATIFLTPADTAAVTLENVFSLDATEPINPIALAIAALLAFLLSRGGGGRDTGGGGGGGGGPCFIATAAYGTPMASEIDTLRGVRDTYLLDSALGTAFVDTYYRLSPAVADVVAQSPFLASAVRIALLPVIFLGKMALAMPTLSLLVAMSLGAAFALRRRGRRRA